MHSDPIRQADQYRSAYAGATVIVLGSTGFIGRWVARELCRCGANLVLPVRGRASAEAIFGAYGINGDIHELDLCDEKGVRELFHRAAPAITFNLSGYGVDRNQRDEVMAYRMNVGLIEILCSAIAEVRDGDWAGLDIVNTGTAMEYGSAKGDLSEDSIARPTTLYGRSKLAGTNVLSTACKRYGLNGVTARLFSVYGPGEAPHRLLPTLMNARGTEESIPLTVGLHLRDFVFVRDVAEGLLRLGLSPTLPGEAVNVATGIQTTVATFAAGAADALGISRERLKFGALPTREEEMAHDPVTIRRLLDLTHWSPGIRFDEGVHRTISFNESISSPAAAGIGA